MIDIVRSKYQTLHPHHCGSHFCVAQQQKRLKILVWIEWNRVSHPEALFVAAPATVKQHAASPKDFGRVFFRGKMENSIVRAVSPDVKKRTELR